MAYYWCSIVNSYEKNTAEWLRAAVLPQLHHMKEKGIRFVALVADNESVNNKLFNLLQKEFPFLIRVPCAAHTVQLVVKQILHIPKWSRAVAKMKDILSAFESVKENRTRLRRMQAGLGHEYPLVKPNDTRWSSTYLALQRLIKLQDTVRAILKDHEEAEWLGLIQLAGYLAPFKQATDILSRDSATLYDIYLQFVFLMNHLEKNKAIHGVEASDIAIGGAEV